jgi:hypothetical protein
VESLLFETYQRLFRLAESRFSSSVAPPLPPGGPDQGKDAVWWGE